MTALWPWLYAVVGPIVFRVFSALGLGWLTYEIVTTVSNELRDTLLSYWGSVPADIFQLLGLLGIPDALGIILSAFAFRIAYISLPAFGKHT